MSKKRRDISSKICYNDESKESLRSDNPNVSLSVSSMFSRNIKRPEVRKIEKTRSMKKTQRTLLPVGGTLPKSLPISGIPKNVAVHFGNFYGLDKETDGNDAGGRDERITKSVLPVRESPRSEFTRQMVHKLEKLAGTEYYASQISAFLEETVEPPNYVVTEPPDDNFLPYERSQSSTYPLWYKDPDKMNYRTTSNESLTSLETRNENVSGREIMSNDEGATSTRTLINAASNNESDDESLDIDNFQNNNQSLSISSEMTWNSIEKTDSDYEEFNVNTVVK